MNIKSYQNAYKNICRLCLKYDRSGNNMVNLFDENGEKGLSRYGKTVVVFADVLEEKSLRFPNKMCQNCLILLEQAISFKSMCEKSKRRLDMIASSCSLTGAMIQVVECSLFWHYFPEKTVSELKRRNPSPCAELDRMEEILCVNGHSKNNNLDIMEYDSNSDESDNILDTIKDTQRESEKVPENKEYSEFNVKCHLCEKTYRSQNSLLSHMKKHNNLEADENPDLFLDTMLSYLKGNFNQAPKKLVPICKICNKTFSSKGALSLHKKRHKVKPIICEICGKTFIVNSELQRHLVTTHKTGKGHKCDLCDYIGESLFRLKEHIRIHTGEKPFTCDKCGLTFRRQYHYKQHQVMHGEKNVKCPDCPRQFYRKGDLMEHRNNVHVRVYMYVCSECGIQYTKPSTVRRHLTQRHGIPRKLQGKISRLGV